MNTIQLNSQPRGVELLIKVEGRIDVNTSTTMEKYINEKFFAQSFLKKLVLDLEKVEYISSAGLRVIIAAQKKLSNSLDGIERSLIIQNPSDFCMQVFETIGAISFLHIEKTK